MTSPGDRTPAQQWLENVMHAPLPARTITLPGGIVASGQQAEVLEWFAAGDGNLLVRARAGTGKTFTTLLGVELARERQILLAAFNKTIARELQSRVKHRGAVASTLHSLGNSFIRRVWKVETDARTREQDLTDRAIKSTASALPMSRDAARLVRELHKKGREIVPLAENWQEIADLAPRFELVPDERCDALGWTMERVATAAFEAMRIAKEPTAIIDFADMIFLPIVHGWIRPMYDFVLVDEAQDMTTAQLRLALGSCRAGGRVCIAGDDRQNLYSFRGTEHDGLDRLKHELRARELPLTITRRCPKRVVELAAQYVPDFEAAPDAPDGEVDTCDADKMIADLRVGDFVLSRKNAPLVRVCMQLLKKNVRAVIRGNDIGKGILALVEQLDADTVDELRKSLAKWWRKECDRARKRLPEEAANERIAMVMDQVAVLGALLEDSDDVRDVDRRCAELFGADEDTRPAVVCSSVHRAKGLEADTVYLLRDTFKHETLDEQNIVYVAITRSKRRLVWVHGEPTR